MSPYNIELSFLGKLSRQHLLLCTQENVSFFKEAC